MPKSYFKKDVKQSTKELFTKPKRKFLPIIADFPNEIFQIDLMFYNDITILSVIDVFSRKGFIHKVSNKKPTSIKKSFQEILKLYPVDIKKVYSVQMDDGNEFKGVFKKYLNDNNVDIVIVSGNSSADKAIHLKQAIVERFNGTMRSLINNFLDDTEKTKPSQKDFDLLNEGYNEHKHSTIRCTPNQAYSKTKKPDRVIYKHNISQKDIKFNIGDTVRLLLQHPKIVKNRKQKKNYSSRQYIITEREGNTFKLNDDTNEFYPYTRLLLSKT